MLVSNMLTPHVQSFVFELTVQTSSIIIKRSGAASSEGTSSESLSMILLIFIQVIKRTISVYVLSLVVDLSEITNDSILLQLLLLLFTLSYVFVDFAKHRRKIN